MDMPIAAHDIDYAEDLLAEGELDTARMLLEELAAEAGEYADTACIATEARQWFSFANPFERLAYRRVEQDPRELTQVDAPLDRLYAALAYVYVQKRDYELARDALKQAVRWNPMNCAHRLNLAEVYRALGDTCLLYTSMYMKYCARRGWKVTVNDCPAAEVIGIDRATITVEGLSLIHICLMSDKTAEEVAREHDAFMDAGRAMGIEPPLDPIMGMIFLPLPVIPTLRIRPEGMFDVTTFAYAE